MLISIIIPSYNVAKYIKRTLDSVLIQDGIDIEVIVINDGSTDNTFEVISSYSDKFINFKLIDQDNSGVSRARNKGLLNASGEFILFLDGDDFIELGLLNFLRDRISNEDYDTYVWNFDKVDENGLYIEKGPLDKCLGKRYSDPIDLFFQDNLVFWTGCVLYNKSIIVENELFFDHRFRYAEDQNFTIKYLSFSKRIKFDLKIYTHYLQRQGSAVNNPIKKNIRDNIRSFNSLKHQLTNTKIIQLIKFRKIPQNILTVLAYYASVKDRAHFNSLSKRNIIKKYLIYFILHNLLMYKTVIKALICIFAPNMFYKIYEKK
ncbi:MAG: glycosyltransferase family 2 protein [Candidatus Delongbacteria bacterium]|nr:glycosyltransferase family 2 protein [Candidatus Delongbacteria bacterium]MBN2836850.1 glycosyltransferase family 2 protein [Candidatus Delongbacteria bacterium]